MNIFEKYGSFKIRCIEDNHNLDITVEDLYQSFKERYDKECNIAKWFKKGQESILRKNESGCCCKWDNDGEEIISLCAGHQWYFDNKLNSQDEVSGD